MLLKNILSSAEEYSVNHPIDGIEVTDVIYDSRKASPGVMFVCIVGFQTDGHKFVKNAYDKGVRVFAVERSVDLPEDTIVITTPNSRRFLALASAAYFGNPISSIKSVAITGTKGKTSTSYMIREILSANNQKVGIIGTNGIYYDNNSIPLENTTPESYEIHKIIRAMVDCGCDTVVIETTSQGFLLDRTYGIVFDIGVFTNLSPDHIGGNEHTNFKEYLNCKKKIFQQCKYSIANSDSEYFKEMTSDCQCPVTTYGTSDNAQYKAFDCKYISDRQKMSTAFSCSENGGQAIKIELSVPGRFSVYNALCAIAVCRSMKIGYDIIKKGLLNTCIKGRTEILPLNKDYTVIIDNAHDELSVQLLFNTVALYKPEHIICVFGCEGNRSKLRRYAMGEIIGKNADLSVITSDNPRYESLESITNDILIGMNKANGKYKIINDRKAAIEYALSIAKAGDVVLLIGKGHLLYEEVNGEKLPFDEREIAMASQ